MKSFHIPEYVIGILMFVWVGSNGLVVNWSYMFIPKIFDNKLERQKAGQIMNVWLAVSSALGAFAAWSMEWYLRSHFGGVDEDN